MRFELTRLAALPPQSSASTNFATHAALCAHFEVAANVGFLSKSSSEIQRLFASASIRAPNWRKRCFIYLYQCFGIIIV